MEDGRQTDKRQTFKEDERKLWEKVRRHSFKVEQIAQIIHNSTDWLRKGYVNAVSLPDKGLEYHRERVKDSMRSMKKAQKELSKAYIAAMRAGEENVAGIP